MSRLKTGVWLMQFTRVLTVLYSDPMLFCIPIRVILHYAFGGAEVEYAESI